MAVMNRHVRHRPARASADRPFTRFPTWMWRNREFEALVQWLYQHNAEQEPVERAGLYGLDLYSMGSSIRAVIDYLDKVDPDAAREARERYACLMPWTHEPAEYGRLALQAGHAPCEEDVVAMLLELLEKRRDYLGQDGPGDAASWFDATQNARLVRNAEKYYRTMYYGAAESWNQRDRHMFETLQQLLVAGGPDARAVVWAHNSHIGDARHTDMGMRGELNLGQLCRQEWGKRASLIGFGTHTGTVAARRTGTSRCRSWTSVSRWPAVTSAPSTKRRTKRRSNRASSSTCVPGVHDDLRGELQSPRLERFIGVVYRPETERFSHYAQAVLPAQFDAYVWFDETQAVDALPTRMRAEALPDTYPFGL
jgi:erythromycin esterase-like protein